MRIAEIHSSELTASCMRKIYHRSMGEISGEATTALYRGLVAGRAMELLHQDGFDQDPSHVTIAAAADTQKQLAAENRILSDAVENNQQDVLAQVTEAVVLYQDRFGGKFEKCEFIGAEVPARYTLDYGGVKKEFASHFDLMVRDTENVFGHGSGRLIVFDWKWREATPSHQYLARNMQFALYYLMVLEGSVGVNLDAGELGWIDFDEPPVLIWFHLPALMPYKRKTRSKNDLGEEQEFVKGDLKPTRSILHPVLYEPTQVSQIKEELAMRVKMIENDFFPLNPDPVSCRICDAEAFCTRFDTAHIGDSQ